MMGCDIHLHVEVKIRGIWHHWGTPSVRRDYELFGKLAGVRDEDACPIARPRGVPDDITDPTRIDLESWASDGHSHSWLGVDEIMMLETWLHLRPSGRLANDLESGILNMYLFGNSFTGWKRYPSDNKQCVEDVRFVFWFDN